MYYMKLGRGRDQKVYQVTEKEMDAIIETKKHAPNDFIKVQGDYILPRDISGFDEKKKQQGSGEKERGEYMRQLEKRRAVPEWAELEAYCYARMAEWKKATDKDEKLRLAQDVKDAAAEMRKIVFRKGLPVEI